MDELILEREKLKQFIEQYREVIEDLELSLDALPRMYSNDPIMLESFFRMYSGKLELI